MAFSIRNARVEEKARAYAAETGTTLTGALERALDQAMAGDEAQREQDFAEWYKGIQAIQAEVARLPVLDPRSPEEIVYDEDGIPH